MKIGNFKILLKMAIVGMIFSVILVFGIVELFASENRETYIITSHPRIFINEHNKPLLQQKIQFLLKDVYELLTLRINFNGIPGQLSNLKNYIYQCAYLYQMTGDKIWAERVILAMEKVPESIKVYSGANNGYAHVLEGLAIGFDWCYDAIDKEKKEYFLSLIKEYYNGNKDNLNDNQDFHNYASQAEFAMLAAGIATYGDNPKASDWIYEARTIMEWGQKSFPYYNVTDSIRAVDGTCNWEGATYGRQQLFSYIKYAEALRTATADKVNLWKNTFSILENAGYYVIYSLRPDNKFENLSDVSYPAISHFDINNLAGLYSAFKNKYFMAFINKHYRWENGKFQTDVWLDLRRASLVFYALWYEPNAEGGDLNELPKSKKFGDVVVMRTGFNEDDTFVTFKSGYHWGFHSQLDHGSFTIFKNAPLAIDSGYNDSWGKAGMPHNWNYWKRSIAHNTLLILNPHEKMPTFPRTNPLYDDGGQRFAFVSQMPPNLAVGSHNNPISIADLNKRIDEFKMGEISAYETQDDYTYIRTDLTNAYNNIYSGIGSNQSKKVSFVQRDFLYIYPDIIVVFDRVEALKPNFKKIWLLHSGNFYDKSGMPALNGTLKLIDGKMNAGIVESKDTDVITIQNGNGKLFVKNLLPAKRIIQRIGGTDYEFWVNGKNYSISADIPKDRLNEDPGAWRIEIQPAENNKEEIFLNVFKVCVDVNNNIPEIVKLDNAYKMVGALIEGENKNYLVLFNREKTIINDKLAYYIESNANCQNIILNLQKNSRYMVKKSKYNNGFKVEISKDNNSEGVVSSEEGILCFDLEL